MEVVVPCDCGTRFSFEVEPVDGRLPSGAELVCPNCEKDGVPLANRVIGETLRKAAAAQAREAAAAPKKKSLFTRKREEPAVSSGTSFIPTPTPGRDPFAKARGNADDDGHNGPNKLKGMIGALVGGALGAGIWAGIVYATGYEIRYVAVGVGALVGVSSRKFGGGRDYHLGLFATVCALLAILAGQWFAANAYIKIFAKDFASAQYETRLERARELDKIKTDEDLRDFVAEWNSSVFKPADVTSVKDDAVAEFKKTELPALRKLAAGEPNRETFIEQEKNSYLQTLGVKDIFIASITPYLFLWVFLGIGAAWRLASDYGTSVE